MSLGADQIQQLLEHEPYSHYSQRHRLEHPVGLTWAVAIPTDHDPHGHRKAHEIANARSFEKILEEGGEAWAADWDYAEGHYIYRLLGQDGQATAVAEAVGPVILGLEDYPFISDEDVSEAEGEYFDEAWESEVVSEIENERLTVWHTNRRTNIVLDFEDVELPDDWQELLFEEYRQRETETSYDDQGYARPNMETVLEVIDRLGWLAPSTIPDAEAEVLVDQVLTGVEVEGEDWAMVRNRANVIHFMGEPPSPLIRVIQDRWLSYMLPRDRGE